MSTQDDFLINEINPNDSKKPTYMVVMLFPIKVYNVFLLVELIISTNHLPGFLALYVVI